ncbi:hypothetical protein B0H16DRAFT_1886478 [Mycena metata]|uniref:Uncharacterized protein n=1 Tax=Mycena metata TaxID=1033252 RepID=A0AAD7J182_9AGAR|nr:hypothetical protein B0H16DRAFT_1886478 [Mycena metata]
MTSLPHAQNSIRRKTYASHYTPSNLTKLTLEMGDATGQMIDVHSPWTPAHTPPETLPLFRHLALDIIVSSSYGFQLSATRQWALEAEDGLTEIAKARYFTLSLALFFIRSAVPTWASWTNWSRVYEMRAAQLNHGKAPSPRRPPHRTSSRPSQRSTQPARPVASEDTSFSEDTDCRVSSLTQWRADAREPRHLGMAHTVARTDTISLSGSFRTARTSSERNRRPSAVPGFEIQGLRLYAAAPYPHPHPRLRRRGRLRPWGTYALPPGTHDRLHAGRPGPPAVFLSPETEMFLPRTGCRRNVPTAVEYALCACPRLRKSAALTHPQAHRSRLARYCSISCHLPTHRARPAASTSHVGRGTPHGHGDGDGRRGRMGAGERRRGSMEVALVGPFASAVRGVGAGAGRSTITAPAPRRRNVLASPADLHVRRPPTPAASTPSTPAPGDASSSSAPPSSMPALTGSVFALPCRMLYAVVTMDAVAIYDTQQVAKVCLLTKRVYGFDVVPGRAVPDALVARRLLHARHLCEILPTTTTRSSQHPVPISYASSSHSYTSGSGSQAGGPLEKRDVVISADFHRRLRPLDVPELPPRRSRVSISPTATPLPSGSR